MQNPEVSVLTNINIVCTKMWDWLCKAKYTTAGYGVNSDYIAVCSQATSFFRLPKCQVFS